MEKGPIFGTTETRMLVLLKMGQQRGMVNIAGLMEMCAQEHSKMVKQMVKHH